MARHQPSLLRAGLPAASRVSSSVGLPLASRLNSGQARDGQEKGEADSELPERSYGAPLGFDDAASDLLDAKRGVMGKDPLLGGRDMDFFEFVRNFCCSVKI